MFLKALCIFGVIFIEIVSHCKGRSHSAIEVIQDGPIQIIGVNAILNCDGIICPSGSIFCYVHIDSIGTFEYIYRTRVCMDMHGEKTKLVCDVRPNPQPGEHYHFSSGNYDID